MDKPIVQPKWLASSQSVRSNGDATRALILPSAKRRLIERTYGTLNVRGMAHGAEMNHALIRCRYRGKQRLVLAFLNAASELLLDRQAKIYESTNTNCATSRQWQQTCDVLAADIESDSLGPGHKRNSGQSLPADQTRACGRDIASSRRKPTSADGGNGNQRGSPRDIEYMNLPIQMIGPTNSCRERFP